MVQREQSIPSIQKIIVLFEKSPNSNRCSIIFNSYYYGTLLNYTMVVEVVSAAAADVVGAVADNDSNDDDDYSTTPTFTVDPR
mmetsp:Transcript_31720/g.34070  ORF Transcript_31720/g.34070 Transcript_31720/m.34070 type:complete len:83 (-) Transcript_31720:926-1174(-)